MKSIICICLIELISILNVSASTLVIWRNWSGTELRDLEGNPLFDGPINDDYDGDIIQIGYYTQATTANPFVGIWTPLQSSTI